ncbi:MAG: hypothetical protein L0K86_06725 [Actinomycetia bacterium]|nr:hypothetical protein [Actinomycetes bacterium]
MSDQQPPDDGQSPRPGPPPYVQQPPQGPPTGPPHGQPEWLQPPAPEGRARPNRYQLTIAALATLVLLLGALSAYLWFDDSSSPAPNASTEPVELPGSIGEYVEDKPDSDDEYAIDIEQTRKDYEEIVGAAFDAKSYRHPGAGEDESLTLAVSVTRADVPLTPRYSTKRASTKVIDDDTICGLAYYEGYDADDEEGEDDKKQLPRSCSRSDDGLTVYVYASFGSNDEALSLDELVEFTDQAYDAAK